MRVALVHDFLTQYGGAERVLEVFRGIWPDAPIYTIAHNPESVGHRFDSADVRTSFIQRLPGGSHRRWYKWYLPLIPRAVEAFDLAGYDLVISDASAFAKGVRVPDTVPHICYLHTPTRYLWSDEKEYLATAPIPGFARPVLNLVLPHIRRWDFRAAQRPTAYVANSAFVAKRLKRYYHRDAAAILHPPVDTERFRISPELDDYWFTVSRFEPHKRLDIVLDAFATLGWPLKVAGTGSAGQALSRWARYPNISFVGRVTDTELARYYARAQGFVFAALEDAGIVLLEAMASGRPVLAYGAGGALETVVPGTTGEFFHPQSATALTQALRAFRPERYGSAAIRAHALTFSLPRFTTKFRSLVDSLTARGGNPRSSHAAR